MDAGHIRSRPSRARGLKHRFVMTAQPYYQVAPLAGAWIETFSWRGDNTLALVAPLAGAWIETMPILFNALFIVGRAPRGRVD